jgi:acyl-CoA thioesterase-2
MARLLNITQTAHDEFCAAPGEEFLGGGRLFGGAVMALLVRASAATVSTGRHPNAMHSFFLSAVKPQFPLRIRVTRPHDGSTFSVRSVQLEQGTRTRATATISYTTDHPGPDVPLPMPAGIPGPEATFERHRVLEGSPIAGPFDIREVDVRVADGAHPGRTSRLLWVRLHQALPSEPVLGACLVAYISDFGATLAARALVGATHLSPGQFGSLNHSLWWHRAAAPGEWLLIDFRPVTAGSSRGLVNGTVHNADGVHVATLTQEAMMRLSAGERQPVR